MECIFSIFLDLDKAFDDVDHSISCDNIFCDSSLMHPRNKSDKYVECSFSIFFDINKAFDDEDHSISCVNMLCDSSLMHLRS